MRFPTRDLGVCSLLLGLNGLGPTAHSAEAALVKPKVLIVDESLPADRRDAQLRAALTYDTFWDNGDPQLARNALATNFFDRTLPPGREQGVEGVLKASAAFRKAVPDLRCSLEQMIAAGDRVVAHLRFTGHFTGTFNGNHGSGQTVDFIATDIYHVVDGRIVEDWHLEDNLTFLQQIGAVPR